MVNYVKMFCIAYFNQLKNVAMQCKCLKVDQLIIIVPWVYVCPFVLQARGVKEV
jgi:hypothetical protein